MEPMGDEIDPHLPPEQRERRDRLEAAMKRMMNPIDTLYGEPIPEEMDRRDLQRWLDADDATWD